MDCPSPKPSPTVLYIDDLPQALDHRKATLESHGYRVQIASSAYPALRILEETPVAAVLLEYRHEGMDAEAVACHIKQRFPNLPIILLSAYSDMPERILWLVDEYVMKSEMSERLLPIIQQAAERTTRPARIEPRSSERYERRSAVA
jgi:DNA-binding NtrC family response regulator